MDYLPLCLFGVVLLGLMLGLFDGFAEVRQTLKARAPERHPRRFRPSRSRFPL